MSIHGRRDLAAYPLSRDYAELWGLAQSASVVCVIDSPEGRDVAKAVAVFDGDRLIKVEVRTRDLGYLFALEQEEFAQGCARLNLEWIVPQALGARELAAELREEAGPPQSDPGQGLTNPESWAWRCYNDRLREIADEIDSISPIVIRRVP